MCQACVNPVVAFSWLGGLLINVSFVALISWGAAVFWPVGLALAFAYTALLFTAASCLRKRDKVPGFVGDIFLLLGVVGVGASGSILAYNVLGCGAPRNADGSSSDGTTSWRFPTTAANGSVELLFWANRPAWESSRDSSFVYEPASSTLFFRARNTSGSEIVWRSPPGGLPPEPLDGHLASPRHFVAVSQVGMQA